MTFSKKDQLWECCEESHLLRCDAEYSGRNLPTFCFLLVGCLAYFSILEIEAVPFSVAYVNFYQTTWRHVPQDNILHSHRRENLQSNEYNIYRRNGMQFTISGLSLNAAIVFPTPRIPTDATCVVRGVPFLVPTL
jgi:hypothetical protein